MSEKTSFTIEQFYKNVNHGKLMGCKCRRCGKVNLPPRPLCDNCYSTDLEWTEMPSNGKLLTYTVIHIAPTQFQSEAPYAVGIVELENGPKIPGMIKCADLQQIKIGMKLAADFEPCTPALSWPQWARYSFKPAIGSTKP